MYRFKMMCPRCNKPNNYEYVVQEHRIPEPRVNCGDCLWERTDIVEMKVVAVEKVIEASTKKGRTEQIEQVMRKMLASFVEDPPDTDFQKGYLTALIIFATEGLGFHQDDPSLTKIKDFA